MSARCRAHVLVVQACVISRIPCRPLVPTDPSSGPCMFHLDRPPLSPANHLSIMLRVSGKLSPSRAPCATNVPHKPVFGTKTVTLCRSTPGGYAWSRGVPGRIQTHNNNSKAHLKSKIQFLRSFPPRQVLKITKSMICRRFTSERTLVRGFVSTLNWLYMY